ncbi:MAG TPA: hypothetical protein VFV86_12210 [Nitrososphaeraceae archaeon]|nr:hypothetical protein [Nitrososphaeraceae archaeon]
MRNDKNSATINLLNIQTFIIDAEIIKLKGGDHVTTIKLNKRAFEHAKRLIEKGRYVFDEKDKWSEHKPSAQEENDFIKKHDLDEYGKWYLGIDPDEK